MYSEMKKNIENSDMPISSATVSAPRSVRRRKIENGISGARERVSITRNAASSTSAPAISSSVSRRAPAGVDGVDERVDEQREPGGDGDGAGDVEVARLGLGAALLQQARREQRADHADRHVDEQHPAPAQPAREHAAEQHAGGAAGAGDGAPHAERAVALGAFGERRRDDRQRRRRDDRRAQALHGARGDQPRLRLGEAAGERGQREDDEPDA